MCVCVYVCVHVYVYVCVHFCGVCGVCECVVFVCKCVTDCLLLHTQPSPSPHTHMQLIFDCGT